MKLLTLVTEAFTKCVKLNAQPSLKFHPEHIHCFSYIRVYTIACLSLSLCALQNRMLFPHEMKCNIYKHKINKIYRYINILFTDLQYVIYCCAARYQIFGHFFLLNQYKWCTNEVQVCHLVKPIKFKYQSKCNNNIYLNKFWVIVCTGHI